VTDSWLRTRPDNVIAETLSDETLVIDTVSGVFFSLRGVASAVWSMLAGTATAIEVQAAVAARYHVDSNGAVAALVAALEHEGLVVDADAPRDGLLVVPEEWPEQYGEPALHKYDDMADLLLVDPIHDVSDDTGWPDRRPGTT
jgi:hypothetical protein